MNSLSVCAETVFPKLPFIERVREITQQGFGVEFWHRPESDIAFLEKSPEVKVVTFVGSMNGSMVHPDGVEEFVKGVESQIPIAKRVRCQHLILVTGELRGQGAVVHPIAEHPVARWVTAYKALCRVAELAEKHDIYYNFENLNTKVDHALYPFPRIEDVVQMLEQVGSPRLRLMLDIYHAQVEEGNIIANIQKYVRHIGHMHMADVPGRHEPGTGEINYPHVIRALREIPYTGTIGMEAFPQGDSREALQKFRKFFEA